MEVKRTTDQKFTGNGQPDAGRYPPTFPSLVDWVAGAFGDRVFLPRRHGEGGDAVTFADVRRDVRRLAGALLRLGVRRGDRIALLAENSYAWILADLAITYIGAVDVPRGVDTAPAEVERILSHAGCRFAIAETDAVVAELIALRPRLPALEGIFSLAETTGAGVPTVFDLMAGECASDRQLDAAAAAVEPEDLLTLVYTSGTTADPKGVMLTHRNMLSNIAAVQPVLEVEEGDVFLSVLPAWHVYERIIDYLAFTCGAELVYTTRRKIKEDLKAVQPTIFAAVPRIWESIHDGLVAHIEKLPGIRRRLLRDVLATCSKVGAGRSGRLLHAKHRLYDATLLKPIRGITGGRLRIAVSGGGALPCHVDHLLVGIGLPLLNGYGLTETSPVVCVRPPHDNRPGTIGPPLPWTNVEVRDEHGRPLPPGEVGVLWIQGPQVMRGYYNNEEATRRVLTEDGWFNSGDLGTVDERGHFRITGRQKDTIVLAGGENVEPEPVETGIKSSALIDQAVVVGQDQKCLGAILIPIPEHLERRVPRHEWGERDGELTGPKVLDLMRKEIDRTITREAGFRPCERVAKFKVRLEPMTVENGLLTPTMKVKRHEVQRRMSELIDGLFR